MNKNNYGYIFNDIQITDDYVIKKGKNKKGIFKINNEILFYRKINDENILLPVPRLISSSNGILKIEYIKKSKVLTNEINEMNINIYIEKIFSNLKILHLNEIPVLKSIIKNDCIQEVEYKILDRYNQENWENNKYFTSINTVNNIKIKKNINDYVNIIKNKLLKNIETLNLNRYSLIHGDTHLGNILVNDCDNLYFIDPRGYFGNTKLYGLKQYDFAKLLFGLSGYSIFDNMEINKLDIENGNLNIKFIKKYENIYENSNFDKITKLLSLSIWLGNNSCFIDKNKKITSIMIAFYYCEKYLNDL